ncbi:hypothetical protein IV487_10510 [Enterococcus saccharolyticus]|uniref:MetQ/NlpA family ABC transporter substrate-binding protein n=1 Tax=Enterococcus saccharolyticus TaxID=41997 RepID=UPI001E29286C|nr:MetQ/NlpA family ABC transporter substrate-binding protein [Enterococcus saccharolyticus]MCD5002894.1 hypothetical protein [Enterococcus saccharolyticus]
MKKLYVGVLTALAVFTLTACGNKKEATDDKVIKVATQLETSAEMVKIAAEVAKKDGWDIQNVSVTDNVAYNDMVNNGEADANFAQHKPFMEQYNEEKDAHLVAVQPMYDVKIGFYSKDYQNVDDIPDGSKVAIPNDPTNEGRALAILEQQGLIKLADGVGVKGRVKDVVENPKNFEWLSVDLLNLSESYQEPNVALMYNYPAYIKKINLTPDDAIFLEQKRDDYFALQIVTREDNQDSEKIKALKKAITSPEVKQFMEDKHGDTMIPSF